MPTSLLDVLLIPLQEYQQYLTGNVTECQVGKCHWGGTAGRPGPPLKDGINTPRRLGPQLFISRLYSSSLWAVRFHGNREEPGRGAMTSSILMSGDAVGSATLARLTPRMLTEAPAEHFHMKAPRWRSHQAGTVAGVLLARRRRKGWTDSANDLFILTSQSAPAPPPEDGADFSGRRPTDALFFQDVAEKFVIKKQVSRRGGAL